MSYRASEALASQCSPGLISMMSSMSQASRILYRPVWVMKAHEACIVTQSRRAYLSLGQDQDFTLSPLPGEHKPSLTPSCTGLGGHMFCSSATRSLCRPLSCSPDHPLEHLGYRPRVVRHISNAFYFLKTIFRGVLDI